MHRGCLQRNQKLDIPTPTSFPSKANTRTTTDPHLAPVAPVDLVPVVVLRVVRGGDHDTGRKVAACRLERHVRRRHNGAAGLERGSKLNTEMATAPWGRMHACKYQHGLTHLKRETLTPCDKKVAAVIKAKSSER